MTPLDTGLREFDVVLWGASSYIGKLIAEHLHLTYGVNKTLRWAIAGRNAEKLQAVLESLGETANTIPVILADSHDRVSLDAMVKRTRVVCSSVGPYQLYGSELIEACVANKTDYCDLSGEPAWIRDMIDKHEDKACENNVRIVHCCGFDSLPSDLGTLFVQNEMYRRYGLYSSRVEMRLRRAVGLKLSGGTYASLLSSMELAAHDRTQFEVMMDPNALLPRANQHRSPDADVMLPKWEPAARSWAAPFIMAKVNSKVVRRSNALAGYRYGENFRYGEGMLTGAGLKAWLNAVAQTLGLNLFMLFLYFPLTRKLLRSLLPVPGTGMSREERESGMYEILFTAYHPEDPKKYVQATVSGKRDAGYGSSSRMIGECAASLALDETVRLVGGGFWTPATCFSEGVIKRLEENAEIKFAVRQV